MTTYNLNITCNLSQYPYQKRFPINLTLAELKEKLQLIVGVAKESMQLELKDKDGKFLASLSDENSSLESLNIRDGMEIHVIDSSGYSSNLTDTSTVAKYEISEEEYEKRAGNVRDWIRRDKMMKKVLGDNDTMMDEYNSKLKVGIRCKVKLLSQPEKIGTISFVGEVDFKPGVWVGVTYDQPLGKHDGTVAGKRYFTCEPLHGAFVRHQDVELIDEVPLREEPMEI